MRKARVVLVIIGLLGYYLFTSGFIFEVMKLTTTDHIDVPYSWSFSGQRVNLIGLPTNDDMKAVEWLSVNGSSKIPVQSGYNGQLLAWEFGMGDRLANTEYKGLRYAFVTSWSAEHNQWVQGHDGGLRYFTPLPMFDDKTVVFQSGKARVYLVNG